MSNSPRSPRPEWIPPVPYETQTAIIALATLLVVTVLEALPPAELAKLNAKLNERLSPR